MNVTPYITADDFIYLENILPVLIKSTGIPVYDFSFRINYNVVSVFQSPEQPVVARMGPIPDYDVFYENLQANEITLIHSPEAHNRCSLISHWYSLLSDLTPFTKVYDLLPGASAVEGDFGWPVFVKGERQTSRHKASTSIIHSPAQFEQLLETWKTYPILNWQKMVCRQFVELERIEESKSDRIPSSFEFRLFYWKNKLPGFGRYWFEGKIYSLAEEEQQPVFLLGEEVANRINVTFLVVDLARTAAGNWIVIEINDGQESGFAGAYPKGIWDFIIQHETQPSA